MLGRIKANQHSDAKFANKTHFLKNHDRLIESHDADLTVESSKTTLLPTYCRETNASTHQESSCNAGSKTKIS